LFGVTERRVEQLAQKKIIPKAGKGLFDSDSTVKAYITYLHGRLSGAILSDDADLSQRMLRAQTLEREAKAAIAQINLEVKKGTLVTIEEVKRQWLARLVEFKAALLEMPKLAAFRFSDADLRANIEEELNGFVIEVLERYSRGGIFAVAGGDNAEGAQTAALNNGQPVGGREPNLEPEGEPAPGTVEDE
jgi:hypothetical protein